MTQISNIVFIDESGDVGFKECSSKYYCVCVVVFDSKEEAQKANTAIDRLRSELSIKKDYEFHFYNSGKYREQFLKCVSNYDFKIRIIFFDKSKVYPYATIRKSPVEFFTYAIEMLLKHSFGSINNAIVIIDGQISKTFKSDIRKRVNLERRIIKTVKSADSKKDNLVQLGDMVVGAFVYKQYKDSKYWVLIRGRADNIWLWGK